MKSSFSTIFLITAACAIFPVSGWAESGSGVPEKLFVNPSSTSTSLARINLSVGTLVRQGNAYRGGYQIKVSPFSFKNEGGKLSANVSDAAVKELGRGNPVTFTGQAVSDDGKSRPIEGRAMPSSSDQGRIEIRFTSKDAKLVFATTYRLTES